MNRHERRAVEARARAGASADKGFEQYRDLYRKAYTKISDREIGEGWMRGETATASGISYMMIHPAGEAPPPPADDDIFLSARYGPQSFLARSANRHREKLVNLWPDFVGQVRKLDIGKGPITADPRRDARQFIFDIVIGNYAAMDPDMAAVTASAIAWLVTTSPIGVTFGEIRKVAHYEITDQPGINANGKRVRNYRMALLNDISELLALASFPPPPQWKDITVTWVHESQQESDKRVNECSDDDES